MNQRVFQSPAYPVDKLAAVYTLYVLYMPLPKASSANTAKPIISATASDHYFIKQIPIIVVPLSLDSPLRKFPGDRDLAPGG